MEQPPLTDEVLHDILQDGLHNAIRDYVDPVLGRIANKYGTLPSNERTGAIIQSVLAALATLPGEHWLPDDIRGD